MHDEVNTIGNAIGSVLLGTVLAFGAYGVVVNAMDGAPGYPTDSIYVEECGACHLAYAPDLLPVESWQRILTGLEDHFGDNAELDAETAIHIGAYLEANGLARGRESNMNRLLRGLPTPAPLRITELPAFVNMHASIPRQLGVEALETGFLSPCADCHREAALGVYDAERLHPGYGPSVWGGKRPAPAQ